MPRLVADQPGADHHRVHQRCGPDRAETLGFLLAEHCRLPGAARSVWDTVSYLKVRIIQVPAALLAVVTCTGRSHGLKRPVLPRPVTLGTSPDRSSGPFGHAERGQRFALGNVFVASAEQR